METDILACVIAEVGALIGNPGPGASPLRIAKKGFSTPRRIRGGDRSGKWPDAGHGVDHGGGVVDAGIRGKELFVPVDGLRATPSLLPQAINSFQDWIGKNSIRQ